MTEAMQEELARLIDRLDAAGQLRLRRAFVQQAVSYAELLLREGSHAAERACLDVVARWLDQPDALDLQQSIMAELEHGEQLEMLDQDPLLIIWDTARATQVDLPDAALCASALAAVAGGWGDPAAASVSRARGPRAAAARAEVVASQWQIAAARAILIGKELPPLPAQPKLLEDPPEILHTVRRKIDPRNAYDRGDILDLRLLLSDEQEHAFTQLELAQITRCAEALLPPIEEDRGERACLSFAIADPATTVQLSPESIFRRIAAAHATQQTQRGLLIAARSALARAQTRRRQASLARAIVAGLPIPAERDETLPLAGRLADYTTGNLSQLCASFNSAELLQIKRALVEQALWYVMQVIPNTAADHRHRNCLAAVKQWLSQPYQDPPTDSMGPVPTGTKPMAALVWKAVRGIAEAAQAPDAKTLLKALHVVIASVTAVQFQTMAASGVAANAVYRAKDYQLAAAFLIGTSQSPPRWVGPDPANVYSVGSIDAAIWQMSDKQHGVLRWELISHSCKRVLRGLEANAVSTGQLPSGRQLVAALQAWAAHPEKAINGAVLVPDAAVEAAMHEAFQESGKMTSELAQALRMASNPHQPPERIPFATSAIAEYCERAVVLAACAIAERWEIDATYAILIGADPPLLPDMVAG